MVSPYDLVIDYFEPVVGILKSHVNVDVFELVKPRKRYTHRNSVFGIRHGPLERPHVNYHRNVVSLTSRRPVLY